MMRNSDKYVGLSYSRAKIYASRTSRGSSSYHSISAASARLQQQTRRPPLLLSIDRRDKRRDSPTDGRTRPIYDAYRMLTAPQNNNNELAVNAMVCCVCPERIPVVKGLPLTLIFGVAIPAALIVIIGVVICIVCSRPSCRRKFMRAVRKRHIVTFALL